MPSLMSVMIMRKITGSEKKRGNSAAFGTCAKKEQIRDEKVSKNRVSIV